MKLLFLIERKINLDKFLIMPHTHIADTKGNTMTQTIKNLTPTRKPTKPIGSHHRASVLFSISRRGSYLGGSMRNSHLDPLFREIFAPYLGEPKKDKIICNRCGQESEIEAVAKCQICGSFAVRLVEVAK